jgi:hypothetical protein
MTPDKHLLPSGAKASRRACTARQCSPRRPGLPAIFSPEWLAASRPAMCPMEHPMAELVTWEILELGGCLDSSLD